MEIWLHRDFLDHFTSLPSFRTVQADSRLSDKRKSRGMAVFVNEVPGQVLLSYLFVFMLHHQLMKQQLVAFVTITNIYNHVSLD